MKFGVNFFPVVAPEKSASIHDDESPRPVEPAEALDFEHVQPREPSGSAPGGSVPDPVVFPAAASGRTRRLRQVSGAGVESSARPVSIAAPPAPLDDLSHGRLDAACDQTPDDHTMPVGAPDGVGAGAAAIRGRHDSGVRPSPRLTPAHQPRRRTTRAMELSAADVPPVCAPVLAGDVVAAAA
ncbi:Luciferase-like monooxygenase [Streptomyces sp. YIM 130001]|uniref:LLM class flavin-dependent oxidoreductase n=1 Tax=Streptomyces sp. YIM 130001 TaxID=2259644 RepID=UPI000EE98AAB|nr:LLM class flavin-dependent oxidoreductase [Streptomyces sp. YIM 130001]RII13427.1 Luciferase-like monooxygenase [Streptomyces sp. YIM 130001]